MYMNIKIKKSYLPWQLKKEWKELENNNPLVSPFDGYDFLVRTFKHFIPYFIVHKSMMVVFKAMVGDNTVALVPMEKFLARSGGGINCLAM